MNDIVGLRLRRMVSIMCSLALVMTVLTGLLGCGSGAETGAVEEAKPEEPQADVPEEEAQEESYEIEVEEVSPFSEGLAWVKYEVDDGEESTTWAGFVDKTGALKFRYLYDPEGDARSVTDATDFEDGATYLHSFRLDKDGSQVEAVQLCWVLDKDGKMVGEFENYVAYGGGYVITADYNASFDSTSYTYHIMTNEGKEVASFEAEDSYEEIDYCGEGVFSFGALSHRLSGNTYNEISFLYNAKANKRIDLSFEGYPEFSSKTGKSLYDCGNEYDENDEPIAYVTLMAADGSLEELNLGNLGGSLTSAWLDDEICTLYVQYDDDLQSHYYSYNIETGELHELDKRYVDAKKSTGGPTYAEGRYVTELEGADGESYVGIFDASFNPIVEPFKGYASGAYSDGRLVLSGGDVYDTDGKLVFTAKDSGVELSGPFSDGLNVKTGSDGVICVDVDGKLAFDAISGFDAKEILR